MRPLALDLFCGAGGASMGLHQAGFDVIGVDIVPRKNYPFRFVQANALHPPFDLDRFDFIWASPPCQAHTSLKVMTNARAHLDLIPQTREMLESSGKSYAIENVFGAPLIPSRTIMLCGTMFGLRSYDDKCELRRHRYFETNFPIILSPPCNHTRRITLGVYGDKVRDIAAEKRHYSKNKETRGKPSNVVLPQLQGFEAMGVDWMNIKELSQAIPPAYGEFIGKAAMASLCDCQHPNTTPSGFAAISFGCPIHGRDNEDTLTTVL